MTTPSISAIIPVYNGLPELSSCLESVREAAACHGNMEVVVVDNGSTDGTPAVLATYRNEPGWRIVTHPQVSIGAVRNFGVRHSSGLVLAFLDSDCVVSAKHFVHIEDLVLRQGMPVTGLRVGLPVAPHWVEATWHDLHDRWIEMPPYINSGNLVVARHAYEAAGGFAEDLTTGEDAEFCARLARAGFRSQPSRLLGVQHLRNPRSLTAFFKKETWRGLGMFGTFRHKWLDKPLLMTFAHGALFLGALLAVPFLPWSWPVRLVLAVTMLWLVPAMTVAYRYVETRRITRPGSSLLLYQIYFLARLVALFALATARPHDKSFGTGLAAGAAAGTPDQHEDNAGAAADRAGM